MKKKILFDKPDLATSWFSIFCVLSHVCIVRACAHFCVVSVKSKKEETHRPG